MKIAPKILKFFVLAGVMCRQGVFGLPPSTTSLSLCPAAACAGPSTSYSANNPIVCQGEVPCPLEEDKVCPIAPAIAPHGSSSVFGPTPVSKSNGLRILLPSYFDDEVCEAPSTISVAHPSVQIDVGVSPTLLVPMFVSSEELPKLPTCSITPPSAMIPTILPSGVTSAAPADPVSIAETDIHFLEVTQPDAEQHLDVATPGGEIPSSYPKLSSIHFLKGFAT